MPFGPFGNVVLGGVQFSTDPEPYEPLKWTKRISEHMAIGGKVTFQDFGLFMKDNKLHLGSGSTRFLAENVVQSLYTLYQSFGTTFTLTDWVNNAFTVLVWYFEAVPFKVGADQAHNRVSLYTYNMELRVTAITTLLGVPYTGT